MQKVFIGFLMYLGILGVAGCGQSGPLYLPDTPPPIKVPPCQNYP